MHFTEATQSRTIFNFKGTILICGTNVYSMISIFTSCKTEVTLF